MVFTWQACFKIAWDVLKLADLTKCIKVWKNLIVPYFSPTQDYMVIQSILVSAIEGGWRDEVVQDR